jgi:hypothetical protein
MSVEKDIPRRIHGQRISRDELVSEARAELERVGVTSQLRAEYISSLATVVVRNPNPLFAPHQPKVRDSNLAIRSWADAYRLSAQFLDENKLTLTRSTADVELPEMKGVSVSSLSGEPVKFEFRDLLSSSRVESDPGHEFRDRVDIPLKPKAQTSSVSSEIAPPDLQEDSIEAPPQKKPSLSRKGTPKKGSPGRRSRGRLPPKKSPTSTAILDTGDQDSPASFQEDDND